MTVPAVRIDHRGAAQTRSRPACWRCAWTSASVPIIAAFLGLHGSTAHRILRRHGAQRLSHLFPKPRRSFGTFAPLRPGELVGVDIKSFGSLERGGGRAGLLRPDTHRRVGWRHLHVAIDMASRLVFTEFRPGLGGADGAAFLDHGLRFFSDRGVRVERVLSDNGSAYRSFAFRDACRSAGIRHTRTKRAIPGPTAGPNASSARSSASARTGITSPPMSSALWRSRSMFPGTTRNARTTHSEASRRRAGYTGGA